ncbi:hypothetical protein FRB91_007068, partial [Serendipita sp. 411]
MSPTATAFHTRKNAPDAMKAISQYDRSFFSSDEKPGTRPSGLRNLNSNGSASASASASFEEKETLQSAIVPALVIQSVGAPATNNATYPNQVITTTTTTTPQRYTPSPSNRNFKNGTSTPTPTSTSTPGPGPRQDQDQRGKRVTLAYDGLAAPVLDIRFSSQAFAFADANVLIKRLGGKHSPSGSTDGSGHNHGLGHGHGHLAPIAEQRTGISRSKTFVGNVAATTTSSSGGGTGTGSGSSPFADPPLPRGRSRSLSQKSTAPPELNNPFADSYEVSLSPDVLGSSQESSSYFSSMGRNGEPGKLTRKRTLSGSSEEEGSLRAIHKLSKKFPSLPPGVASVRPEELFANANANANANASAPRPRPRSKSMNNMGRRKPPPQLLTDLEEEAESVTLVTQQQQQQQQPTPVRARMTKPRPRSKSQPPVPAQTVLKRNAGVYDDVDGEYEIAGGDSPRRFAGQLSPTTSLDQDVAMRTRRRIRNHLSTITPTSSSVRSSAAGGDDEQWAT